MDALLGQDTGRVNFDDLDPADKAIRRAINASGNLCAKPILVSPTPDPDMFGIVCITTRSGKGRSEYLVNSKTGAVVPL